MGFWWIKKRKQKNERLSFAEPFKKALILQTGSPKPSEMVGQGGSAMEKRFMLFLVAVGFIFLTFGCGGGGGDGGGSSTQPVPSEPAYRIEHEGDVLQVPSAVEGKTMRVIIKDKTFNIVPGMLVRVVYDEFWAGELQDKIRIQDLVTNAQGLCLFEIPRYDGEGDRTASISLPSAPEIKEVLMTIRYVVDITLPTKFFLVNPNHTEILLPLSGIVEIACAVLNAWGNPIAGIESQVIIGGEYVNNVSAISDDGGMSSFTFVAGVTAGSTVFRVGVVGYPLLVAEGIISWREGGSPPVTSIIEMLNPSRWEGFLPVAQILVGNSADVLFVVKDKTGQPVEGVMVMFTYPASESDTSDANGVISVTVPAIQSPGFDLDKVWVIGQKEVVFLDFKIEYLNP